MASKEDGAPAGIVLRVAKPGGKTGSQSLDSRRVLWSPKLRAPESGLRSWLLVVPG